MEMPGSPRERERERESKEKQEKSIEGKTNPAIQQNETVMVSRVWKYQIDYLTLFLLFLLSHSLMCV